MLKFVCLQVLQDRCLQRKKNELLQLFLEEFGKSYTDMFESFTEEPIAAASLAQVTYFYNLFLGSFPRRAAVRPRRSFYFPAVFRT